MKSKNSITINQAIKQLEKLQKQGHKYVCNNFFTDVIARELLYSQVEDMYKTKKLAKLFFEETCDEINLKSYYDDGIEAHLSQFIEDYCIEDYFEYLSTNSLL